jgi:hypothetical protein
MEKGCSPSAADGWRLMLAGACAAVSFCGVSFAATVSPVALKVHRGANSFRLESQYRQPTQVWNADGTLSVWFTSYNTPRAKVREDGAGIRNDGSNIALCFRMRNVEPPYEMNAASYPVILEFQIGRVDRKDYVVKVTAPCELS